VVSVLNNALNEHNRNRVEIEYLWKYYKGEQPIERRTKDVRPEICNKVVENRANEIVTFKSSYLLGEPVQYVSRSGRTEIADEINTLNEYMYVEDKESEDKELSDWFHICGTAYRFTLPNPNYKGRRNVDEAPHNSYCLDPRFAFVVYSHDLGHEPLMGVKYVTDANGTPHYSCYTKDTYYEVSDQKVLKEESHIMGMVPIIEYPLNIARLGAFEIVLPLLDAINTVGSNRIDGVEQFVQALMLFKNVEISSEEYDTFREKGAIKFKDIDPQTKAEITYLISSLNQTETQTLVDHMYDTILTIVGMPNRNGGSSTSDTGTAVIYRDGWSSASARAKDTEMIFKKSEKRFLKLVLNISKALRGGGLKVSDIDIRFTRRNYENILQKAQVLDMLLNNDKVADLLAFEHSGMFADPGVAYEMSKEEYEAKRVQEVVDDDSDNDTGSGGNDPADPKEGIQS
jgi:SPP1 family phage portal protein